MTEVKEDLEAIWQIAGQQALAQALDELDGMRVEEGAALVRDITGRLETDRRAGSYDRCPIAGHRRERAETDDRHADTGF